MGKKLSLGILIFLAITLISFLIWVVKDLENLKVRNSPQRQLIESAKMELLTIDLSKAYPETLIGWIDPLRQKWLAGLDKADNYLLQGKQKEAKKEVDEIKGSIEYVSESDDAWFRNDPKKFPSKPDKNGDGISDWFDNSYKKLKEFLEKAK